MTGVVALTTTGVVTVPAGTVGAPAITTTGDANTGIYFPAADTIGFSEGGVESGRFTSTGALQLNNNLSFSGTGNRITGDFSNATVASRTMFQTSTTNTASLVGVVPNGTDQTSAVQLFNQATPLNTGLGQLIATASEISLQSARIGSGTYLPMTFYTGGSERVMVDTSGNVGIGTSSPAARLNVQVTGNGDFTSLLLSRTTGSINQEQSIVWQQNDLSNLAGAAIAGSFESATSGSLRFKTTLASSLTERMRIDSSGNLLVGTTTSAGKLTVTTSSGQGGHFSVSGGTGFPVVASVNFVSSTATAGVRVLKYDNNTTTSQVFVQFAVNQDGANCGQINANGANTAAFGTYSDARLKENITDLPSQLASILALRPVEFDYIQSEGGGHQIGFIAQEMEQVYPDVVGERADGMKTITAWSKTEARLVKAIQEQQAIIEQLTQRIAALENKGA
jgi:hypothetical protein